MSGSLAAALDDIRARMGSVQYREHAVEWMMKRSITTLEIEEAVGGDEAEVIESDHTRFGPCELVAGWTRSGRSLHVLFGTGTFLWVITAYDPSVDPRQRFLPPDYRVRRSKAD